MQNNIYYECRKGEMTWRTKIAFARETNKWQGNKGSFDKGLSCIHRTRMRINCIKERVKNERENISGPSSCLTRSCNESSSLEYRHMRTCEVGRWATFKKLFNRF